MGLLLIIINIILDVFAGILAWNIVDPDSFWGGLLFLLLWGVFGTIAYGVSYLIVGLLASIFEN